MHNFYLIYPSYDSESGDKKEKDVSGLHCQLTVETIFKNITHFLNILYFCFPNLTVYVTMDRIYD